jgi:hypothetical protein
LALLGLFSTGQTGQIEVKPEIATPIVVDCQTVGTPDEGGGLP